MNGVHIYMFLKVIAPVSGNYGVFLVLGPAVYFYIFFVLLSSLLGVRQEQPMENVQCITVLTPSECKRSM